MPPERVAFVIYNNSRLRSRKSAIIVNNKLAFASVLFASLTLIAPGGKTSAAKSSLVNSSRRASLYGYFE